MRKLAMVGALSVAVTLLLLGMRAVVDGGSRPAEAGAAVQPNANVALVGSSQSWKIASKGNFPFDRVIVKVVTGGPNGGKVARAVFRCQGTGDQVISVAPKRVEPNTSTGGVVTYDEVWSANFLNGKCVETDNSGHVVPSSVNVTLEPVHPTNKLVIKKALVQNTHTLVPQESAVNFARILNGPPDAWKITIKDSTKGYNRLDLVLTTARTRTPRFALFFCPSSHELAFGTFKQQLATPNQELWSINFRRKCTNSVLVLFLGFDHRSQIVIKSGRATNTTHLIPIESSATATLKGKTQTFKLTSKAIFDADRVDVQVATVQDPLSTRRVSSAVFVCHPDTPEAKKAEGVPKGFVKDVNPGSPLPDVEVWSVTFLNGKCIPAGGSVTVKLVPVDSNDQLVIKAAFVENTSTPTPTPAPTPIPGSSPCVKVAQNVPFPHNPLDLSWDAWKCSPSLNIDWNRVDIYVVSPGPGLKLSGVQFDCQDNPNATTHRGSKAFGTPKTPAAAPPGQEVWSGEGFADPKTGQVKNCTGAVNVLIQPAIVGTHPIIKEAIFSHTGAPKVPPPKLPLNGSCVPVPQSFRQRWLCTPDAPPDAPAPPYNRVDIKVASPATGLQLASVQMSCAGGTIVGIVGFKGQKIGATAADPPHEVWSADFGTKCDGVVSVTLKPFVAGTSPDIIGVTFSNPPKPNVKPACPFQPDLPFPEPGCDQQASTIDMVVEIADPPLGVLNCSLAGETSIARGPVVQKANGLDSIDTRIFFGKLAGTCADSSGVTVPGVTLHFKPSAGRIVERVNVVPGTLDLSAASPADSFFDVFFEVDTPIGTLHNSASDPARVAAKISKIPPKGSSYRETSSVLLYDSSGRVVGKLVQGSHTLSTPTPTPAKALANGHCDQTNITNSWLCIKNNNPLEFRRIDIWVGKSDSTRKVSAAWFGCFAGGSGSVDGVFKGQKANDSTEFPLAEQWSADFPAGCFVAAVVLQPADAANILVIKKTVFS